MNKGYIPNTDVRFWTQERELPQGNFLCSLTQPKITRQRHLELTDIDYYIIKYYITRTERVEYITGIERNVMNIDDIEDFENL